jgi:hypothetical protein
MLELRQESRRRTIETLRAKLAEWEASYRPVGEGPVTTGIELLDRLLPGRALRLGSLVEWLAVGAGSGATTLALAAARQACRDNQALVVIDRTREFYPPAAVGLDLERTVLIRPTTTKDEAWAWDQALRSPAVGAVFGWMGKLDATTYRRLALSAEVGGTLGLVVRPDRFEREPSWAAVRFRVEPRALGCRRRLLVQLVRCRGMPGGSVELDENEPDWEPVSVSLPTRRATRPADRSLEFKRA